MGRMSQIVQLKIECEPEFETVFGLLGEYKAASHETKRIVASELERLRKVVTPVALLRSFAVDGDFAKASMLTADIQVMVVLLTLGNAGEQYVQELLRQGEHLRALVADAILSAWLFAADECVKSDIRDWCREHACGVKRRLEAPDGLALVMQKKLCDRLHAQELVGVHATDAHMLVPEKSMCYLLELCSDREQFEAGHDCARCENEKCGMRKGMRNMPDHSDVKKNSIQIVVEDQGKKYACDGGLILFDTLREHGVRVDAPCGGGGRCGKCRVRIVSGELPVTASDRAFLSERELAEGVRLACTARPTKDLRIRILAKPKRKITTAEAVAERTAGGDPAGYGIAVDIGTTTLAACIYGWENGQIYQTVTGVNSGRDFGADVLSRMEASCNGKRARLQELLQEDVRALLQELVQPVGASQIQKIVIAANMTMVHLLMGYSCATLGRAPFVPVNQKLIRADGMRILGAPEFTCPVELLPAVSAFVGGDIVAGMLALGMSEGEESVLLLDVGTNGEMALRHQGQIYVTSTAAGPAFEGGGISCGCASVKGAICGVRLTDDGKAVLRTIGDASPVGICGSGVLEIVSELLRTGAIDATGLFADAYREKGFLLGRTAAGAELRFTQADVRALQLAKGAIRAGIETLLAAAQVQAQEVTTVYLAGGFGVRMDETAAIGVGLLPEAFQGRICPVGNTSLSGAMFAGKQQAVDGACETLLSRCRQIVLAEQPEFEARYIDCMNFREI